MSKTQNNKRHTPESFWQRVNKVGSSACWLWQGSVRPNGYGIVTYQGQQASAHRIAYQLTFGPVAHGMDVCHRCDVRLCCNPDHLFVGTRSENIKDAVHKRRLVGRPNRHNAKLMDADVVRIRFQLKRLVPCSEIAALYGVSRQAISDIKHGRKWGNV